MSAERKKLLDKKVAETVNQAISQGLDPFFCIIVLQTYEGLTIRCASDDRVLPVDDRLKEFLAKVDALVEEYVSGSSHLRKISGMGPS